MKALALRVPRAEAELSRRGLREEGLLRTDLGVERDDAWVFLPLAGPPTGPLARFPVVEHEFPEPGAGVARNYRELLEVSAEIERKLPRSFDVVGDIVLVRLPEELSAWGPAIGRALLKFVPAARLVAEDRGVRGADRIRHLVRLAGDGPYRTRHVENGIPFTVDLESAYFSPRLAREHAEVAGSVAPGERVLDLCCGIGPFARTIARRVPTARITAVDANPRAIELLAGDLVGSSESDAIVPIRADAGDFLAGGGTFDRAILNLPHEGSRFLAALGPHLRPGGRVHYYEIVERSNVEARRAELPSQLGPPGRWGVSGEHVVHEYSPRSDLRGYLLARAPEAG